MEHTVRIGTRGSKLALWQARWVKTALEDRFRQVTVEIVKIRTRGDKILDVPLAEVGGKGLFVKEIEQALLDGRIDLAVHSMKDMPADIPAGLAIGAIPEREKPHDVLISGRGKKLGDLPGGSTVGTSSLRRASQILSLRPDLVIRPLRGNLDTRLQKLADGQVDAVILAAAGIHRLGLEDRVTEYLAVQTVIPAVGQGALCIETRQNDPVIGPLAAALDHGPTRVVVEAERAFLARLEGGCQVPIAAHGMLADGRLELMGMVSSLDGTRMIRDRIGGRPGQNRQLGVDLAGKLLARGGKQILEQLKSDEIRLS